MLVQVGDVPGLDLDLAAYNADFWQEFDRIGDVFWTLERIQEFREPGVPSWEAMNAGDWERSLSLLREGDVVGRAHHRKARFARRRVRVAEHPVSHYLRMLSGIWKPANSCRN
jgi:hypothetical protein